MPQPASRKCAWSDQRLVRECCTGNQDAWSALIDKYKNLIFSIPLKFGVPREEAADIFQAVCLDLLVSLPKLREPDALPKWLMQIGFHKCLRWKKDRLTSMDDRLHDEPPADPAQPELPEEILNQVQREQILREAITELPPRCVRMVEMLFFENPPRPYEQIAKELGIATGSVGFIRGRCLSKLREKLQKKGFE